MKLTKVRQVLVVNPLSQLFVTSFCHCRTHHKDDRCGTEPLMREALGQDTTDFVVEDRKLRQDIFRSFECRCSDGVNEDELFD